MISSSRAISRFHAYESVTPNHIQAVTRWKPRLNWNKTQPQPLSSTPFESSPGSYMLLIVLRDAKTLAIGRLGYHAFKAGLYIYTGSAHGPGGLRGRIERHLRHSSLKRNHWHIDILTAHADIAEVWWTTASRRLECHWAEALTQIGDIQQARFGASDCRCPGHLTYFGDNPYLQEIWEAITSTTPSKIHRWANPSLSMTLEGSYAT